MNKQFLWLIAVFASACGPVDLSNLYSFTLGGTVLNWPVDKTGSLRIVIDNTNGATVGASASVNPVGAFSSLAFPGYGVMDVNLLTSGTSFAPLAACQLPTTNNLRSNTAQIQVLNTLGQVAGTVIEANRNLADPNLVPQIGDKQIIRLYGDQSASLIFNCPATGAGTQQKSFNVTLLPAGWNIIVREVTNTTAGQITAYSYSSSATVPNDIKFYYVPGANPLVSATPQR